MARISKNTNILISGHRGFLGSNMMMYLKKLGYKNINKGVADIYDFKDYYACEGATFGMDWVFHFAANMGGVGYFSKENYYPVIDNFLMDINMLRACEKNKVKKLFYPASACAYPTHIMNKGFQLTEDMLDLDANPDQMYGWEKLTMIKLMRNSPVDCRVGVLHTIYGEGQEYEGKKAKFPPQMAYKAILAQKTGKIEVWGDGNQTRTFLYIDDAIEKIYEVMMKKNYWGEVNIGSDIEVSVNDVVKICCDILKIKPKIKYNLKKPTGPTRRLCSNEKFNKHYKYRDKIKLEHGFRRIIRYIQNNGSV